MNIIPPENSTIELIKNSTYPELSVPHNKSNPFRYFMGLFLIFWMGGWFMGFISAINRLQESIEPFFLFWICGWTLGGILAASLIYRIFRPSISEKYILNPSALVYDSGIPPFNMPFDLASQKNMWKNIFIRRRMIEFSKEQVNTIALRDTSEGNRLTIDNGTDRIEMAQNIGEIEKEWLYETIKKYYS